MQETISVPETPNRRVRRTYTKEFKRRIVSQCDRGDKSIAQIALEHKINANLIHKWSRQLKSGEPQPMVPVALSSATVLADPSSRIDVLLGNATVRFYGVVDQDNARAVLGALQ